MSPPENETPPAATEGVDYNCAGEQPQATAETHIAQHSYALMPPPGLVGELAAYFYSSARYPMKEAAILAALGLVAGVAGRSFNYEGTGLNLYLLLLAESGRGKEDMRGGIDRLLSAVRMNVPMVDEYMGPDTFASGQALIRVLENTPCFVSIQGEFGLRLKELNDPRAPSSVIVLRRVLLDLYGKSGWNGVLRPTVYSERDKNTKLIHAPCVTILGESTPGHVFDSLSFRDIEDGLLPRCLLLECNDQRPRANNSAGFPPPPEMAERFADLVAMCLTMRQNNSCMQITATPEAAMTMQEMQDELDDAYNDEAREPHDRALWNRAGLNIRRVAAIIAVGCMPSAAAAPIIEEIHVRWAASLVEHSVGQLAYKFREGIVGSGEARQEAELKKYVREYLSLSAARRRAYKVPQRLSNTPGCIGLDYLRRRARRCAAFTQDRRGFERALSDSLNALCRTGALFKLPPHTVHDKFGLRGEVYAIGDPDTYD